jgi:hypothetical protein
VEIFSLISAIVLAGIAWGAYETRRNRHVSRLIAKLAKHEPIYLSRRWTIIKYQWVAADADDKWQRCILLITHKRIAIYPYPPENENVLPLATIQPHELRGFWRPVKYHSGNNDLWVHAQIGLTWGILKLQTYHSDMQKLIRAMKEISSQEQTKAYRRRRPYIHREPTRAFPAEQSLTGDWELSEVIRLYLMPLYLVIFSADEVQRSIELTEIQDIAALKRMEGGKPTGLIRFTYADEDLAFALDDYEKWASDLADAAKRTLEEPVMRKRKSKDDEDEWDDFDE